MQRTAVTVNAGCAVYSNKQSCHPASPCSALNDDLLSKEVPFFISVIELLITEDQTYFFLFTAFLYNHEELQNLEFD